MLEISVPNEVKSPVKFLKAECDVRYWEDAKVNGVEDEDGSRIPCREGDCWKPLIDLETGVIQNWREGTEAEIHYKVCDAGFYTLLNQDGAPVVMTDGYVPSMLSPNENGYGDYVIMKVDDAGRIEGWKADLSYFEDCDS